jgi:hypothetical protein
MRSEKELIQLLLDSEKFFKEWKCFGLCHLITRLWCFNILNNIDREKISDIIKKNNPTGIEHAFYFKTHQWKPRKKYLENLLKKYE